MGINFRNRIVIGLTVFCTKCMREIRPAAPEDMNGNLERCKRCKKDRRIAIGISVHSDSIRLLHQAYHDLQKSEHLIQKLLEERTR